MNSNLENYLDSQIATVSDLSMVSKCISRPEEEVAVYDPLLPPFETPLHQRLRARSGELGIFEDLFKSSKRIASELGPWCSDAWWSSALKEERLVRQVKATERRQIKRTGYLSPHGHSPGSTARLDQQIATIQETSGVVQDHQLGVPQYECGTDLSTKVKHLIRWLRLHYEHPTNARCMVFVERRDTAKLLEKLFHYPHIGGPHLRVASFLGSNSSQIGEPIISTHKQLLILKRFRQGEINLLFATSVAEEGLDIPDCNLVVRFDLYKTMIGYMQSRGRARHTNSIYLHMAEKRNCEHSQILWSVRREEETLRSFFRSLPADRRMDESEEESEQISNDLSDQEVFEHPETKAKLTYNTSLVILAHYVSSLPHHPETVVVPTYIPSTRAEGFVYEVILPENSPILSAAGCAKRRKILAKCSAAFNACLKLIKGGHLNSKFMPSHVKRLPAMRNARLAISSKKSNMYEMMTKPRIWEIGRSVFPEDLFVTVLDLPCGYDRPHCPIALLTRTRMPDFPSFPLYLQAGNESWVKTTNITKPLKISTVRLEHVDEFTRVVYHHVFAKVFEANIPEMSYWFAPVSIQPGTANSSMEPSAIIDWNAIENVCYPGESKWNEGWTNDSLLNRFFWDRYNGGKRYFAIGIEKSLNMDSPIPDEVGVWDHKSNTIKQFTVSSWANLSRKHEGKEPYNKRQPVLLVESMMERRNFLDKPTNAEKESRLRAFVIPQPLERSSLSTNVAAMAVTFPCIIHRLESYLIAMEACQFLELNIPLDLALEAITKDSDNTGEHGDVQVNFQRGMGRNYERLEFLGDCFLKMATSIAIYTQNPNDDEFEFHVKRMLLVCNQTLFDRAKEIQLTQYVRSQSFSRRLWYQDGLKLLRGKKVGTEGRKFEHSLGDKTVADICEALIGAAFLAHNNQGSWDPDSWKDAVHAVTTFVSSEEHCQQKWDDYLAGYIRPEWDSRSPSAVQLDLARKVERAHDYHFQSPKLLQVSFKHPSYPRPWLDLPSYQRLEFLGDALLDMTCVTHLFYRYPNKDPQWLTEHKMAMVSNRFLSAICVKLGFHKHLLCHSDAIQTQIFDFVSDLEEAEKQASGAKDYWTTVKSPPKCLADIVEAFVGAVFVDSKFDYHEVQRFFDTHMRPFFEDMTIYDTFASSHPTSRLHHIFDEWGCTNYRLMAKEIASLDETRLPNIMAGFMVHDDIIAHGQAASGKNAKVKASKAALDKIDGLTRLDFRRKFHCDCGPVDDREGKMDVVDEGQDTAI